MPLVAAGIGKGKGILLAFSGVDSGVASVLQGSGDVILDIKAGMAWGGYLLYLLCCECYRLIVATYRGGCNSPIVMLVYLYFRDRLKGDSFPFAAPQTAFMIGYTGLNI